MSIMRFLLLFGFVLITSANRQMTLIGQAWEGFNPCDELVLSMGRLIGGPPKLENYWDGTFYFKKWPGLTEASIDLAVDNKARIEFNEDDGAVAVNGKTFQITVFDEPLKSKTFNFKVRGTPRGPFPNVQAVTLNGEDVCKNPRKWTPTLLGNRNVGETEDEQKPMPTCGKRLVQHEGLIMNGFPSKEGDWPWHAALYHIENLESKYKCGGSLINKNVVITAAHCVYEGGRAINSERLLVQLGKHNLLLSGPNTQEFQIHRVIVHEGFNTNEFQHDIAILHLKTQAALSNYVQPICLWDINEISLNSVLDLNGAVVGWGLNEREKEATILSQAYMPVVSLATCLNSNRNFFGTFLNDFNFCAGFRNGTTVCNGDSGGGMYFEKDGIHKLRGVVSLTVSRGMTNLCNAEQYVVFTDVAKYLDWIEDNLN